MSDMMIAFSFRIFWAAFLAFMLAGAYHASWKAENGRETGILWRQNNAVVWMDPIVLTGMLGIYFLIFYLFSRSEKRTDYIFSLVFDVFLFISIYFTLLLFLLPLLRKYYAAKTCATLWLIPVFLYYQPHVLYSTMESTPAAVIYIAGKWKYVLLGLWISGFVILMAGQTVSHIRFADRLKKHSWPVEDLQLTEVWENARKKVKMDITQPIELRYCSVIGTPLTIGMSKKNMVTYLPARQYTQEEAELVFCHELHHIRRNDTHTKFFLRFCHAFGWIHPFVWLAVKKAEDDLELSCDEIVLKDADDKKRRKYAELLLSAAGSSRGYTTCLSASARTLRYRMKVTVQKKKKRQGIVLLFLVMFLSCTFSGRIAFATDRKPMKEVVNLDADAMGPIDCRVGKKSGQIQERKKLLEYLSGLSLEKVICHYETIYNEKENELYAETAHGDGGVFIFSEYVTYYDSWDKDPVLYHISEPIDWEYIETLR